MRPRTAFAFVPPALVAGLTCLLVLAGFALSGPYPPATIFVIPLLAVTGLALGLRRSVWWYFSLFPLLLIMPPPAFFRWFDGIAFGLGLLALLVTARHPSREMWDVRAPGLFACCAILLPLLALPFVVGYERWIAMFKVILTACVLFVGMRRVVPSERSRVLLAGFPVVGAAVAIELFGRMSGLGGLLTARPQFRNFYTNLGWGTSNYIGAILVLTIGASVLLYLMDRSGRDRIAIAFSILLQLQALLLTQSRGATVALALMMVLLLVSGGVQALVMGGLAVAGAIVGLASPSGQILVGRFLNPQESASWFVRLEIWQVVWARFLGHPWTGIGLNQGPYQGDEVGIADAHNVILQALMEQGVFGGILTVAVFIGAFRVAARARPTGVPDHALPRVRRAIAGVILAVFVHAMVEPTLNGYEMLMLFSWFLGWLALQDGSPSGNSSSRAVVD